MKKFVLCLSLFLGLMGCVPTAVSDLPSSSTVTGTAVPSKTPTLIPITPTQTAAPPSPTNTPVARPTRPSPTPTATPFDFPQLRAQVSLNNDYNVAWNIPIDWQEVSSPAPSTDADFWQAWINDPEAVSTQHPSGQMTLTMFVETVASAAAQPEGTEQFTYWGHRVWTEEIEGSDTDSFDLRLSLMKLRAPYRYNYRLDCVYPEETGTAGQETFESLCRYTWDFLFRSFGLCAVPMAQDSSSIGWQQVSDNWYQYLFSVPGGWLIQQGATADRLKLLSDPTAESQPNVCPLPNGIIAVDFSVDPPGNFGTGQPGSAPDTAGYTETTIAGHPAWIQIVQGGELMGPADVGTTVYIKGDDYWYHFWLLCIPPTDADVATQDAFKIQCEDTISQILASFEIR